MKIRMTILSVISSIGLLTSASCNGGTSNLNRIDSGTSGADGSLLTTVPSESTSSGQDDAELSLNETQSPKDSGDEAGLVDETGSSQVENNTDDESGTGDLINPPICGNGIIEGDEQCDCGDDGACTADELNGASCSALENGTGSVRCDESCVLDLSLCTTAAGVDSGTYGNDQTDSSVVDQACDPADMGPEATPVDFVVPFGGAGIAEGSGEFKAVMENDPGIPTHTIIRPEPLGMVKHPILAWGNGGCRKNANDTTGQNTYLFKEFASHGVLIVADGPSVLGGPTMPGTDAAPLLFAIEWAREENERPCSKYYHKLDVDKVAVSGQSCGGLMAFQAAVDPGITTAFLYNSGLFTRDRRIYDALHAPMAIFDGGPGDIAYANGLADFNSIDNIPILFANPTSCSRNAHVCTFFDEYAGEYGRSGVAWMRWHLFDDLGPTGKGMFVGDGCGLCGPAWDMQWKNMPE